MADADATELQGDGEALRGEHPEERGRHEEEGEPPGAQACPACIFSAFQAVFFFVVFFEKYENQFDRISSA